jgi:hypothetical protein
MVWSFLNIRAKHNGAAGVSAGKGACSIDGRGGQKLTTKWLFFGVDYLQIDGRGGRGKPRPDNVLVT